MSAKGLSHHGTMGIVEQERQVKEYISEEVSEGEKEGIILLVYELVSEWKRKRGKE